MTGRRPTSEPELRLLWASVCTGTEGHVILLGLDHLDGDVLGPKTLTPLWRNGWETFPRGVFTYHPSRCSMQLSSHSGASWSDFIGVHGMNMTV